MSTLTSGEYDFISNLVGPAKEQRSPMTGTACKNGIVQSSAAVNSGDGHLYDVTKSVRTQKDGSAGLMVRHVTTESTLLTEDSLNVHWHEPLMEGLLGPIIKYLESEGIRIVPNEEYTIDGNMKSYVQGTTSLKDIEHGSGP